MFLQRTGPNAAWTSFMFQTRPFEFLLLSDAKNISLLPIGTWGRCRTSGSVSSPTNTVSTQEADSTAFWTMSNSVNLQNHATESLQRLTQKFDETLLVFRVTEKDIFCNGQIHVSIERDANSFFQLETLICKRILTS